MHLIRDSYGRMGRNELMGGFIGHLYLANLLSHFKGLFSHVLNATSLRTDLHFLPNQDSRQRQTKNFTPPVSHSFLNNSDDNFYLLNLCHPTL